MAARLVDAEPGGVRGLFLLQRPIPDDPNDTVRLIVSLLVRHSELSRIAIDSKARSISFYFIVRGAIGKSARAAFVRAVHEHMQAFHDLDRRSGIKVAVEMEAVNGITIVEVRRDTRTVAREELAVVIALLVDAFGSRVATNPPADGDDDPAAQEEMVGNAFDALRRGKQKKSLVGFRDERRVLARNTELNGTVSSTIDIRLKVGRLVIATTNQQFLELCQTRLW